MERQDITRAAIYTPLMLYQLYLSWRFYNNLGMAWITNLGWLVLWISALFGWLPIYEFKKKGGVPENQSYVIVRHPQFLAGVLICLGMMLISQHPQSVVAGIIASIVYASEVDSADRRLIEKFGEPYREYMEQVPALNFVTGIIRRVTK